MTKTRFVIVANCQARSLSQIVKLARPDWEHLGDIVVHLSKPDEEEQHHKLLRDADVIFAQLVQDHYPIRHLATSRLAKAFGNAVLRWPNLFFHGQNTDTINLTAPRGARLTGPLIEYHSLITYRSWLAGRPVSECIASIRDEDADPEPFRRRADQSLALLRERETEADVGVADYVERRFRRERLFHVFNHPTSRMMTRLARLLLGKLRADISEIPSPDVLGEPLGHYVPLMPPAVARALELRFPTSMFARGVDLNISDDGAITRGRPRVWRLEDFVATSYRCYDAQAEAARAARITPAPEGGGWRGEYRPC